LQHFLAEEVTIWSLHAKAFDLVGHNSLHFTGDLFANYFPDCKVKEGGNGVFGMMWCVGLHVACRVYWQLEGVCDCHNRARYANGRDCYFEKSTCLKVGNNR
jgi:hypothetical protein